MPAPRTRATKTAAKPSTSDTGDLSAILGTVTKSETGVKRAPAKDAKPILTLDHVKQSLAENVALQYTVTSREQAEAVKSDLQRAASHLGCGVSKSVTDNGNGTFTVDFQANRDKRKRNYSSDDIRVWARDVKGLEIPKSRAIPEDVRRAYRVAHGYEKVTNGQGAVGIESTQD